jgi:quercetin 2,3-dioxygenase
MLEIRRGEARGHADHGWLNTFHTFSFADYYDPKFMGFGPLRVINDDTVAGGGGFPPHGHRDMEIVTYVLDGALEHQDSMGTGSVVRAGEVQRMSAGTGVVHSEFNASERAPVHLLQIWLLPAQRGLEPSYEQKRFDDAEKRGRLRLVVSPDGAEGSLRIHQDARILAGILEPSEPVAYAFAPGRAGWLHVATGSAELNGTPLKAGDGAAVVEEERIILSTDDGAEVLLFDLPA